MNIPMIGFIKEWVEPKAGVRIVLRAKLTIQESMDLQALVRSMGTPGWLRVVQGSHVLIELEGSKMKLDALVQRLQQVRLSTGAAVLQVKWLPFKGEYRTFRAGT